MEVDKSYITSLTLQTILGAKGAKVTLTVGDIIKAEDLLNIISERKLNDLIKRKAVVYGRFKVANVKPKWAQDATPEGDNTEDPFNPKHDPSRDNPVNLATLQPFDSGSSIKDLGTGNTQKPEDTLPTDGAVQEITSVTEVTSASEIAPEDSVTGNEPETDASVGTVSKRGRR